MNLLDMQDQQISTLSHQSNCDWKTYCQVLKH